MDRDALLERLAMAERHIAAGEEALAHQRAIIEQLEQDGHYTGAALALLATLEQTQALQMADRDRVRAELSRL